MKQDKEVSEVQPKLICGVVIPISAIDGCTESHWSDVLDILTESIEDAGFEANLVSNAEDVGIIHKRIIQNLYDNPIVVCDVSGKNPNVMFELGLRLAFDKPTIIVKDDKTAYSFDTSAIEHLDYPRDLRFSKIVEFKQKLSDKIKATYQKSSSDTSYTTFLKHFGEFTVAKLDKKEVSGQEYILEELRSIRTSMRRLEHSQVAGGLNREKLASRRRAAVDICLKGKSEHEIAVLEKMAVSHPALADIRLSGSRNGSHKHLFAELKPGFEGDRLAIEDSFLGRSEPPNSGDDAAH